MGAMDSGSEAVTQSRIPGAAATRMRAPGTSIPALKSALKGDATPTTTREGSRSRIPSPMTTAKPSAIPSPAAASKTSAPELVKATKTKDHFMRVEVKATGAQKSSPTVPKKSASKVPNAPFSRLKQPSKLPNPNSLTKPSPAASPAKQQKQHEGSLVDWEGGVVEEGGGERMNGRKQPAMRAEGENVQKRARGSEVMEVPEVGKSEEVPLSPQDMAFLSSLTEESLSQPPPAAACDSILHSAEEPGEGSSGWLMGASEGGSQLEIEVQEGEVELNQSASSDILTPVFAQAARAHSWLTDEADTAAVESRPPPLATTTIESAPLLVASPNHSEGSFLWHEANAVAQSVAMIERKDSFAAMEAMVAAEVGAEAEEDEGSSLEVSQCSVVEAELSSVQCAVSPIKSMSRSGVGSSHPMQPSPLSVSPKKEEGDVGAGEGQGGEAPLPSAVFAQAPLQKAAEEVDEKEEWKGWVAEEKKVNSLVSEEAAADGISQEECAAVEVTDVQGGVAEEEAAVAERDQEESDDVEGTEGAVEEEVGVDGGDHLEGASPEDGAAGVMEVLDETAAEAEVVVDVVKNVAGVEEMGSKLKMTEAGVGVKEGAVLEKDEEGIDGRGSADGVVEEIAVEAVEGAVGEEEGEMAEGMKGVIGMESMDVDMDDVGEDGGEVRHEPTTVEGVEGGVPEERVEEKTEMELSAMTSGEGEVELELSAETNVELASGEEEEVTVDDEMVPLETSVDSTAAEHLSTEEHKGAVELTAVQTTDQVGASEASRTESSVTLLAAAVDASLGGGSSLDRTEVVVSTHREDDVEVDSSDRSSMSFADLSTTSLASKQGFFSPTEGRIHVSYPVEDWDFSDDCLTPPSATVRNSTFGNPMFIDLAEQQASITPGSPGRDPDVPATQDSMPATNPLFDEGSSFERSFDVGGMNSLKLWPGDGSSAVSDDRSKELSSSCVVLNLTADIEAVVEEAVKGAVVAENDDVSSLTRPVAAAARNGSTVGVELNKSPATVVLPGAAAVKEASRHIEGWEPDELSAVLALCIRHHLTPDWQAMLSAGDGDELLAKVSKKHRNVDDLQSAADYLLGKRHAKAPPPQRPQEAPASTMDDDQPTVDASMLSFKERMAKFRAQEAGDSPAVITAKAAPSKSVAPASSGGGSAPHSPDSTSPPLSARTAAEQPASHAISSPTFDRYSDKVESSSALANISPPQPTSKPSSPSQVVLSPSKIPRWSPKKEASPSAKSSPPSPVKGANPTHTAVEGREDETTCSTKKEVVDEELLTGTAVHSLAKELEARTAGSPEAFPIPLPSPMPTATTAAVTPVVDWSTEEPEVSENNAAPQSLDESHAKPAEQTDPTVMGMDVSEGGLTIAAAVTKEVAVPAQVFLEEYFNEVEQSRLNAKEAIAEEVEKHAVASLEESPSPQSSQVVDESSPVGETAAVNPPPGAEEAKVAVKQVDEAVSGQSDEGSTAVATEKDEQGKKKEEQVVMVSTVAKAESTKKSGAFLMSYFGPSKKTTLKAVEDEKRQEVVECAEVDKEKEEPTVDVGYIEVAVANVSVVDPEAFLESYFGQPEKNNAIVNEHEEEAALVDMEVVTEGVDESAVLVDAVSVDPSPATNDPQALLATYFGDSDKSDPANPVSEAQNDKTEHGDTVEVVGSKDVDSGVCAELPVSGSNSPKKDPEAFLMSYFGQSRNDGVEQAAAVDESKDRGKGIEEHPFAGEDSTELPVSAQPADDDSSSSSDSDDGCLSARKARSSVGKGTNPWGDMNLDLSTEVRDPAVLLHSLDDENEEPQAPVAAGEMWSILSSSIEEGAIYAQDGERGAAISFEVGSDTTAGEMFFDCTENSNTWSADSQISPRYSNPLASHPVAVSPSSTSSYYDCDEMSRSSSNVSTPHRLRNTTPQCVVASEHQSGGSWKHEVAVELITSAAALLACVGHFISAVLHNTDPIPESSDSILEEVREVHSPGPDVTEHVKTVDVHVAVEGVREVSPEEEEDMVRDLLGGISADESSASDLDDSRISVTNAAARTPEFARITEEEPTGEDGGSVAIVCATTNVISPTKSETGEKAPPEELTPMEYTPVEPVEAVTEVAAKVTEPEVALEAVAPMGDPKDETRKSAPFCGAFRCFNFRRSGANKKNGKSAAGADVEVGMNGQQLPKVEYEEVRLHTVPEESETELTTSSDIPAAAEEENVETPPEGTGVAAFLAAVSPKH